MHAVVCRRDELAPGEKRALDVGGRRSVLVRTGDGRYFALADVCPHQGARLSDGHLGDELVAERVGERRLHRPAEILRCPWHNFAFDVTTGRSLLEPERYRVKTYPASVEDGDVVVEV